MEKKDISYYLTLPYSIHIQAEAEGGFFARVEELKGCMTQGESLEEVAGNIRDALEAWLTTALDRGITIPEPESYSGKFVLRIPKSLHRKLAESARRENLSLNQFLIYLLTEQNTICTMKRVPMHSTSSRDPKTSCKGTARRAPA
ncbi:MAG: type II toxin-antitoxin system HicB family antitoxin [Acidobacteria bacterium]|nr:type II toxin-antitoxin system HicB family antitoxin [Acidobacteriota bacterium]MBU4404810.1 type II toxin-antitoxin system HicB family antitoxin [Acidobacteriota bacterium]